MSRQQDSPLKNENTSHGAFLAHYSGTWGGGGDPTLTSIKSGMRSG